MRAYTTATVAFTLKTPAKTLDNILSHNPIKGAHRVRQGKARRLPLDTILVLAIGLRLTTSLEIPLTHAMDLADRVLKDHHLNLGNGLSLSVDVPSIREQILDRLQQAVETVPIKRRGRPAGSRSS